jgi:hypothetical protein
MPPIKIGDPVGAAAEPVDGWLLDCWLVDCPAVVGELLDDVLLLEEQATSTTVAATHRTPLKRRKLITLPPAFNLYTHRVAIMSIHADLPARNKSKRPNK